ncbi:MAG: dienelactone hydrolase family protein, partial [Anaerolineales bacterium]|nr:dienelactone hydrolase family protein [Anaerolineales bacterium]
AAQPILTAGAPVDQAPAALILLHGRGADARDILSLAAELGRPDLAYLAPQAAGLTWYPNRFIMPAASNEPWLTSALARVGEVLARVQAAGLGRERIFLLGFSQGACLALEFAARHPARYAGVFGLSGALIENGDQPRDYAGSLAGTPVFLGCSDVDPHIPRARVERSAQILPALGAEVTLRLYPNLDHTVNRDELRFIRGLLDQVAPIP